MDETFVYLNGKFIPRSQATIDIEDRGFMFADGVYELTHFYGGRPFAMAPHLARLGRSLKAMELAPPMEVEHLGQISAELVRRNNCPDAGVYWQITRGPAPRNHAFPKHVTPTVLVMTYPIKPMKHPSPVATIRAITAPDIHWHYPCYKTLMLLGNVLAKEHAHQAGADEAILHRDGKVTEGSSTNVIVIHDGVLRTHPADQWILEGVTRGAVLECARELDIRISEEALVLPALFSADEVFITGSTTEIAAVTHVDGRPIGGGKAGPVVQRLFDAFLCKVAKECGLD